MKTETRKKTKLTLVGAGPGDVDLITVKGVEAIGSADVILYDALVNKELLKYAPYDALKIYVGKRKDKHTFTQDEINSLIVESAFSHGHVVRLKGGDAFVFGRGYEELSYAESLGIETVIVPGISSSIAVPELQGIPVTNRGTSESFWVITGTTSNGKLSSDIELAAKSTATVVILMGLNKLNEIVGIYKKQNKQNSAVAVIQNGSLPSENSAIGTIETIGEIVREEKIGAPAIIVIGDVVKLHPYFSESLINSSYVTN
ncbi:MAG: uroporphyrinogen-III C-methyltransferase [Bacteroidetes bacterium RIFCSPLOWO2_12_FULL_35_15]|nr:MAG: uroporphyrinogen-III C-methyltransferase [Bacteroidetes bacterium RIFCSPLOWO2_12_FULL_35_15]